MTQKIRRRLYQQSRTLPPDGFASRSLPIVDIRAETVVRTCRAGRDPIFFGRTRRSRFDDPQSEFGVLYGGLGLACCVAEAVIRGSYAGQPNLPPFHIDKLKLFRVVRLQLPRGKRLRLVDLTGANLLKMGGDANLSASLTYGRSQAWSRAIATHPSQPHGLIYASRYDNELRAVAVFEPALALGLTAVDEGPLPDHPDFPAVVERYAMGLV